VVVFEVFTSIGAIYTAASYY